VNLGTLTAFVLLFQSFFAPIVALGDQWQSIQAAVAGAERVFDLLDMPTEEKPSLGHPDSEKDRVAGRGVELSGIGFAYTSGRAALAEVSFAIEPGEHLALVGRTGAGKSTIVALAGGLYAPHSGAVRLAGLDPHTMADDERRRLVGVVPQTLQLFSGTLRDNLSFFDPTVPDDAIWDALRIAGVVRLVDSLPGRLDVMIAGQGGGRGARLSAGQRQLLALARALVPRPAVLVLDEATAVVDAASDAAFRAALRQTALRRGCAVLTVAHRIATARSADRVVVLEGGRVVEIGTPAGLMEGGGRFAAFAALEAAGWDWQAPLAAGADATVSSAGRDAPPSAD
ncbi:MAG: ABC transporter ATP-binding protein, partial [Actinomycetota bacterium]|nr:ABC transporter ATP-binding protein [Actinomycetota bacterium]